MKKYYKIQTTERVIGTKGLSLYATLQSKSQRLYKREQERIDILYDYNPGIQNPISEKLADVHNIETSKMYVEENLPEFIIIVQNEDGNFYELISKEPITVTAKTYLFNKDITKEEIKDFFEEHPDYKENVTNFFSLNKKKETIFEKINRKLPFHNF